MNSQARFPLELTFKILAIAPQIRVKDAGGNPVLYVKQKLLKLKEHVEVFTDDTKAEKVCDIKADRLIDWSAAYLFTQPGGGAFGGVRRKGARSLWRAYYEIFSSEEDKETQFTIREEKAMVKVLDGLFSGIPVVGAFAGYFFNPTYIVARPDGTEVARLVKNPALWEGKFTIERSGEIDRMSEARILVSLLMLVLLERARG